MDPFHFDLDPDYPDPFREIVDIRLKSKEIPSLFPYFLKSKYNTHHCDFFCCCYL